MRMQYYFLGTLLPTLKIGAATEIDSQEFDDLLQNNLQEQDYDQVRVLQRILSQPELLHEEIEKASGFLRDYLTLERDWRLELAALRAKKDPEPYEELKPLFEEHQHEPLELHLAFEEYRFAKIESMVESDPFSIERILGFCVQLNICERWLKLDRQQGLEMLKGAI